MEHEICVGKHRFIITHEDLDEKINAEQEIAIDYSNLAGEAMVAPMMVNIVGMTKAELEKEIEMKALEIEVFKADFVRKLRWDANKNNGEFTLTYKGKPLKVKMTEKALEKVYCGEKEWQQLNNELFILKKNFAILETFYWRLEGKAKKLEAYMQGVTPEEFITQAVEGKLNGFMIKKVKQKEKN